MVAALDLRSKLGTKYISRTSPTDEFRVWPLTSLRSHLPAAIKRGD
jgi:hypothetical protein